MFSSPKIIWILFAVGILALGISINQLNRALDVTEGRKLPADYRTTPVEPN